MNSPWIFFFNFFLTFIYFWDRERDRAWMGEGQREGDTESETGSRLWAVSTEPDAGLELTDRKIMTWAEVGRTTDWATQVPQHIVIFIVILVVILLLLMMDKEELERSGCRAGFTYIPKQGVQARTSSVVAKVWGWVRRSVCWDCVKHEELIVLRLKSWGKNFLIFPRINRESLRIYDQKWHEWKQSFGDINL